MLISKITKKGDAVPHTPEGALPAAILYGIKKQNTQEKVYWVTKDSVKKTSFSSFVNDKDKYWTAQATGTAMIGWTDVKANLFYKAKLYHFSIKYRSTKDNLGLPDIEVVSMDMKLQTTNPRALHKAAVLTVKEAPPVAKAAVKKEEAPKPVVVDKA